MIRVQNWQKRLNVIIKSIEQVLDHWQNKLENLDFWFAQPNDRDQKFVSFLLQWCLLCTNEWSFMQQSLELGQSRYWTLANRLLLLQFIPWSAMHSHVCMRWAWLLFYVLTLLGPVLIKINTLSTNSNNTRPSLILSN